MLSADLSGRASMGLLRSHCRMGLVAMRARVERRLWSCTRLLIEAAMLV